MPLNQRSIDPDMSSFQPVTNTINISSCNGISHRRKDPIVEMSVKIKRALICAASQSNEEYIQLHNKVFLSGRYNFEGCRIPLKSNLNIDFFRFMLYGYEDEAICDFFEFGFPLGYIGKVQQQNPNSYSFVRNHSCTKQFSAAVQKYLLKEKSYGAIWVLLRKTLSSATLYCLP